MKKTLCYTGGIVSTLTAVTLLTLTSRHYAVAEATRDRAKEAVEHTKGAAARARRNIAGSEDPASKELEADACAAKDQRCAARLIAILSDKSQPTYDYTCGKTVATSLHDTCIRIGAEILNNLTISEQEDFIKCETEAAECYEKIEKDDGGV